MPTISYRTFSRGEISPSLHSRVDLQAYHTGLRTCRNNMVRRDGGAENRPGTTHVAEVKDSSKQVRMVPFIFDDDQTYVLEFGHGYIRFHRNGQQIREPQKVVTGLTAADPAVVTCTAHGFVEGDTVYIERLGTNAGMNEVWGQWFRVSAPATDTFALKHLDGEDVNSASYTAFSGNLLVSRVYEIGSPYLENDLMDLDVKQSANIYIITHKNHYPRKLVRTGPATWTLSVATLTPSISAPTGLSAAGTGAFWVVTAVKKETLEESYASSSEEGATPSSGTPTALSWTNQTDAVEYNVYRRKNGVYGFVGVARWDGSGNVDFSDNNIPPDMSIVPPETRASVDGFDTTFAKITDPGSLPAGNGRGVAWSPDKNYVAVAHATSPYVTVWRRTGDTFTKITGGDASEFCDAASYPAGAANAVCFSTKWLMDSTPGGRQIMAVAHATSPFVSLYEVAANKFIKLANPSSLPASTGNGVAFSFHSDFLAVAHATSPYVTVYRVALGLTYTKVNGGDTSQFCDSAELPTGTANGVSWTYKLNSTSFNNQILAVAHDTSPYVSIYIRDYGTQNEFSKTANPVAGDLPAGNGQGVAWSPDGTHLAVAHTTTPFISHYKCIFDAGSLTVGGSLVSIKRYNPADLPAGNAEGVSWSPNGFFFSVNHASSPYTTAYELIGDTPTKITSGDANEFANAAGYPAGVGYGSAFSPDSDYMAVVHDTSPYVSLYQMDTLHPAVCFFYQQRLGLARTIDDPERIWMSRTSYNQNFSQSLPIQTDDSFNFRLLGRSKVAEIRHAFDLGRLVVLTAEAEILLRGDEQGALTPFDVNPRIQSYNGAALSPKPIIIDNTAIYCQARTTVLRDLMYDYEYDGYKGTDLTKLATHLFDGYKIVDMTYQDIPHSTVWAVRDDGVLLGLTYVREEQILAWHRHDTYGNDGSWEQAKFERVCCVPEGDEDAVYVVVKRWVDNRVYINGVLHSGSVREVRNIERFTKRHSPDYMDPHHVDNGFFYDGRNYSPITMTLSGGTNYDTSESLTLTSSEDYFLSTDVGDAIHLYYDDENGVRQEIRCLITAYSSATVVTVTVHRRVDADYGLRATATLEWARAKTTFTGLWFLGRSELSCFADGYVVASPHNYTLNKKGDTVRAYDALSLTNGVLTLARPYAVVHVGLPFTSDLETLDVDMPGGGTLVGIAKKVSRVYTRVLSALKAWVGPKQPPTKLAAQTQEPLKDMALPDNIGSQSSSFPLIPVTDVVDQPVAGQWNTNGRVFHRQVDPVPSSVLSIHPEGIFS